MPDGDGVLKPKRQNGFGNGAQGVGGGIVGLIDVKIDIQIIEHGEVKEIQQPLFQVRHRIGDRAKRVAALRDDFGNRREIALIAENPVNGDQTGGLKLNLAAPCVLHFGNHAKR